MKFDKINQYTDQYVAKTFDAVSLGVRAGLVCMFLALYNIYYNHDFPISLALIGTLVVGINESVVIKYNNKVRLGFTFIMLISTSWAIFYSSYISEYSVISIASIIISMFLIAFTSRQEPPYSILFFLIGDFVVIGNGLPSHSALESFELMKAYFYGGAALFITSCVHDLIFQLKNTTIELSKPKFNNIININQDNVKFGVVLSVAVLVSFYVAKYFKLPQGYWLPMTTLIVLKSEYIALRNFVKKRLIGTIVGGLISFPLVYFVQSPTIYALLLFPVALLTMIGIIKNYTTYVTFLTLLVTILLNFHHHVGALIIRERIFDTLIGIGVVIVVIEIILPLLKIKHAGIATDEFK